MAAKDVESTKPSLAGKGLDPFRSMAAKDVESTKPSLAGKGLDPFRSVAKRNCAKPFPTMITQNTISNPRHLLRYTKDVKLPCSPNMAVPITYQEDVHATQGMGRNKRIVL